MDFNRFSKKDIMRCLPTAGLDIVMCNHLQIFPISFIINVIQGKDDEFQRKLYEQLAVPFINHRKKTK